MSAYVFPSAYKGGRPVRLCEATRRFAMESLQGKYGAETMQVPFVSVDCVQGWENMSEHERYAAGLDVLVRECPVRICEGERVCGAATLGAGVRHQVPMARDGKVFWLSVSHLTVDFGILVREGILGMRARIESMDTSTFDAPAMQRHDALLRTLDAMQTWHARYLEATKAAHPPLHEQLLRVPLHPARSFAEAVQKQKSIALSSFSSHACPPRSHSRSVSLGDSHKTDKAE